MVNVTPLLRELIVRANLIGALDVRVAEQKRLIGVIFDELRVLNAMPLQLPLPRDPRAARFAAMAEENLPLEECCATVEPAGERWNASFVRRPP